MTTYIWLTDAQKTLIENFNLNGSYIAVICSMPWGDSIIDNLNEYGYEQLRDELANAERVVVDDNGNVVSGTSPAQVPLWCLRTVIKLMGLFNQVNQAIENMPSNTEEEMQKKIAAWEGWEYGNTVARHSYTTSFVQNVLNLSDDQVDQIFINADKVDA